MRQHSQQVSTTSSSRYTFPKTQRSSISYTIILLRKNLKYIAMKKIIIQYLYIVGVVIGVILISMMLSGCATKPKPSKSMNPIANAKELGIALGCVFAPNTCKTEAEIKQEQDDITKEFDKIDAQKAKEAQKQ